MTSRTTVGFCLLALLCLASWLFAGERAALSESTPVPTPLDIDDVQTRTADKADEVGAKIDALILVVDDLRAAYRAQQEKRASRQTKIVVFLPTPLPTVPPPTATPKPKRQGGGLLDPLFGR